MAASASLNAASSRIDGGDRRVDRVRPLGGVDQVHQRPGALEVAEEVDAEAHAAVRAGDQPRDVGDHQGHARRRLRDAEVGVQCGERVRGDLGVGAGERRQQRGLARVRQPDQADVGDELELEVDAPRRCPARRARRRAASAASRRRSGCCRGRRDRRRPPPSARPGGRGRTSSSSVSASRTIVPGGTWSTMSSPAAPWRRFLPPAPPAGAWKRRRSRKPARVESVESATSTTSPPRPPSPPSGPPMGTYFSRRKLTAPRPPSPPATSMVTSSRNVAGAPR